jgi:hypothetical protein
MIYVELVARNTPAWVFAVFALLLYLGFSRLRPRRMSLRRAMLAPAGFFVWSVWSAVAAASASPRGWLVASIWLTSFMVGWWSCRVRIGGAPPQHLGGGVFLFAPTVVPLVAYMLLFWTRFGLEVWAAFEPSRASALLLAGILISAGTAGRTWGDFLRLLALRAPPGIRTARGAPA